MGKGNIHMGTFANETLFRFQLCASATEVQNRNDQSHSELPVLSSWHHTSHNTPNDRYSFPGVPAR